ncbi:uncharacterized protein LOC143282356 [Babylonia areolata]|uniref:uncharacterized protein LOC143282356 n=1 Tax=Babylonia areolata TaxID=304850 RepID=UPI003FD366A5
MFQREGPHRPAPAASPPGVHPDSGQVALSQRPAAPPPPLAATATTSGTGHHRQQQATEESCTSTAATSYSSSSSTTTTTTTITTSSSSSSKARGRSPKRRLPKPAASAPSTPRGHRDKSRDRSAKAATLDSPRERKGGGKGVTTTTVGRRTRSLNRSQGKQRLSAPPLSTAGGSRAPGEGEAELSVDARAPGVIKLFGESVVQGAQYKAVLASTRSTCQELLKQALERYGLAPDTHPQYVLCDAVGIVNHPQDPVPAEDSAVSDHVEADENSDPAYASIADVGGDSGISGGGRSGAKSSGWIPVSMRILDNADRPLELQMFWKPPEGLSRRFELHRRDEVVGQKSVDDTCGLNDNARRIMMSKVAPGAIPPLSLPIYPDTERRNEGNYVRTGPDGRLLSHPQSSRSDNNNHYASKPPSDTEVKYACVCPSIYPYLLTLRGQDIQKDLVLYPLKSKTLNVGRHHKRSHADDIGLLADDVQDLHCRIHLKTLAGDPGSAPLRRYWYCLHVEVFDRAVVFLNGVRVEGSATVQPGDLLGVGHHYLFLYKDPTGGFDIPESLPWYPGAASLYAKVKKTGSGTAGGHSGSGVTGLLELDTCEQDVLKAMVAEVNNQEYLGLEDSGEDDSGRRGNNHNHHHHHHDDDDDDVESEAATVLQPLTVPYPPEREGEVLEHVTAISCSSPSDFPLTTTVLLMGCHGYAARRFPPSHMAGFFRRLLRAVRNRVSVVSKALSVQKYQRCESSLYAPAPWEDGTDPSQTDESRDGDPLLELLCWLANVVRIHNHVTSAHFRASLAAAGEPLPSSPSSSDVTASLQELCEGLEEMISFMFQQTVYSITKVLFAPVAQILHPPTSPSHTDKARAVAGMERVLHVLRTTLDVSEDVSLHNDVIIQLLTYLIFFVTTTLFNKLMSKSGGCGTRPFCWSVGVRLQACVSQLEDWVGSVGLETHYLQVSERLLSLVDLLATSRHTLLRMDWPCFRKQYSPLSESQLLKVLSEYQFSDGQPPPASWLPPPGVTLSDDVTISLSSHPSFVLPRHGPGVDLTDTFPPALYRHLDTLTRLFATHSGTTGGAQGERNSDSWARRPPDHPLPKLPPPLPPPASATAAGSQDTFFTSDLSPSLSHSQHRHDSRLAPPLPPQHLKVNGNNNSNKNNNNTHNPPSSDPQSPPIPHRHKPRDDESPPPLPPKLPPRSSTIQFADPPVQPFPEHRVTGVQSARAATGNGSSSNSSSAKVSFKNVPDYARVTSSSTRSKGVSASDGIIRSRQEPKVPERLTQSAGTPHYCVPPSHANGRPQQDHRDQHGTRLPGPPASSTDTQVASSLKREPPPYHKANSILHNRQFPEGKRNPPQDSHKIQDSRLPPDPNPSLGPQDPKGHDPRRRHLNGVVLTNGPLSLQEKRVMNKVPPLELPPEDLSGTASDSVVSDEVFIQTADAPPLTRASSLGSSDFRRHSTGMLSKEKNKGDKPEVVKVDMHQEPDSGHVTVETFPDDIYIDVMKEETPSGSARQLRVLPLNDGADDVLMNGYDSDPSQSGELSPTRVRYRHKMPQERDSSTKGEITGEVFTLSLYKEGARLGMGLIDGMYTPLKLPGIYVRNVLPGTPAALCGHIRVGDRILAVNGRSIVGADYNSAMKLIRTTGPRLNLLIAKTDRSVTACISAS